MRDASCALVGVLKGAIQTDDKELPGRIATVVLLAGIEGQLLEAAVDGLVSNRFRVDGELIRGLYWAAPRGVRPSIAAAPVASHLEHSEYRDVWCDAFRSAQASEDRLRLGQSLVGFLIRNPAEAEHFATHIRRFLQDESATVRDIGLLLLATLRRVSAAETAVVARALSAGSASARLAALGAAQRWLVRGDEVVPGVLAFARSEPVIDAARHATKHRDSAVRMAARNYLRILKLRNAAWRAAGREGAPASPSRAGSAGARGRPKTKSRNA